MKRKLRVFAMLLAAVMMFNEAGVVYATSDAGKVVVETSVSDNEAVELDETVSGNDADESVDVTENDGTVEGEESVIEEGTEEDIDVEEETEIVEEETESEEVSEETVSAGDAAVEEEETVSANDLEEVMLSDFDFPGMELSAEMVAQKAEVAAVVAELENAVPGEDYVDNILIFTAESGEKAKEIAAAYNQENVFWQDGIAMIHVPYATLDVLKVAADMNNNLPAVYPNLIYKATNLGTADAVLVENETAKDVEASSDVNAKAVAYTNDAGYANQWHHGMIGDVDAWNANVTGAGVDVVVIDSGIDSDHPDLKANIKGVYSTVYKTGLSGYPVDENGNLIRYMNDLDKAVYLSGEDENGHGTHVAGIIAADDNTIGGVGVAPEANIHSIRALDANGAGTSVMIYLALKKAQEIKPDVVNMSLGSLYYDYLEAPEVAKLINAGTVVVASAGNDGDTHVSQQKNYPAGYPNVISVGALERDGDLAWFSTNGDWVTIAAPGGTLHGSYDAAIANNFKYNANDIYSTYLNGGYAYMAGTSQASPVVAGTIALLIDSRETELAKVKGKSKVTKITNIMLKSAYDGIYYDNNYYGWVYGALNASEAILSAEVGKPTFSASTVIDGTKASQPTIAAGDDKYIIVKADNEDALVMVTTNGKTPNWSNAEYWDYGEVYVPANKSGNMTVKAVVEFGDKKVSANQKYKLVATAKSISAKNGTVQEIMIGKSVKMEVVFNPVYTTDQKMTWTTSDKTKFSVNANNGTVKCTAKAKTGDTATITGTLKSDPTKKVIITVKAVDKGRSTVTLADSKVTLSLATYESNKHSMKSTYNLAKDVTANCKVSYTSSNKKVAVVDEKTGKITAVGKGSCNITVKALDGSGKKVVKKVKVTSLMDYMEVYTADYWNYAYSSAYGGSNGTISIANGSSIKLNTYVEGFDGKAPSNKKINWTTTNKDVKVTGGKLVCGKDVPAGTKATVTGAAADGSGLSVKFTVTVYDKPSKIGWKEMKSNGNYTIKTSCKANVAHGDFIEDVGFPYIFSPVGKNNVYTSMTYTFSNPDVCYFDYEYDRETDSYYTVIRGAKKGKCVITYKTLDGSNKSCKFTITVK